MNRVSFNALKVALHKRNKDLFYLFFFISRKDGLVGRIISWYRERIGLKLTVVKN